MKFDQIQIEEQAYESVRELLAAGRKCQELHERAGLVLPQRVQWLLGLSAIPNAAKPSSPSVAAAHIPAPDLPKAPRDASPDWIAIPVAGATVTTVALAILRAKGEPLRSRDLAESVMNLLPNSPSGSIANAGTRLVADGIIERSDDGWNLLNQDKAAVLQDGLLWGPSEIFVKQEIATHRREAILHVLRHFPKGLQIIQIVEQLKNCAWLHAPANKDLVKMDMQSLLTGQKVRRVGNTKKWQIAPLEKAE